MTTNYIYSRKSSEQEDRQILSLETQLRELNSLTEKRNIEVDQDKIIQESYSAKSPGRPLFNQMLDEIEGSNTCSTIISYSPDRLSRNSVDTGRLVYLFDIGKLTEIITPTRTFTNTPEDKFFFSLLCNSAKWENDNKGLKVKGGLETKAKMGWLPSGAKHGYMNDKFAEKGSKTILKDPERFPLIKQAWEMMISGTYSPMQILKKLNNELGYRTQVHKRIGGKPMAKSAIYDMLSDPFYYGEFEFPEKSGKFYKGSHEPMITKEEFDKVQILLGKKGRPRPKTHVFDYSGLITCGECSAFITAEEKYQIICPSCKYKFASLNKTSCPKCKILIEEMNNPKLLHYIYYHCTKRKNPDCMQLSIRVEDLEKQFDLLLSKIEISPRFKDWAIKYLKELSDKEIDDREEVREVVKKQYDECVRSLDNLIRLMLEQQVFSPEEFKIQKDSLTHRKAELKERLDNLDNRIDKWVEQSERTFNFATNARYWFEHGSTQEKREILASLGSNLILKDRIISIDLTKPLLFIEEAKKEETKIIDMLEPKEKIDNSAQIEALWYQNTSMLRD